MFLPVQTLYAVTVPSWGSVLKQSELTSIQVGRLAFSWSPSASLAFRLELSKEQVHSNSSSYHSLRPCCVPGSAPSAS